MNVAISGRGLWTTLGTDVATHAQQLTTAALPVARMVSDSTGQQRAYYFAASHADHAEAAPHNQALHRLQTVIAEASAAAGLDRAQIGRIPWLLASSSMNIAEYEARLQAGSDDTPYIGPRFSLMLDQLREREAHTGRASVFSSACASAANALLHGYQMIRQGQCEQVLVIASENHNHMSLDGFGSLMLLTPSGQYRPFDAERDGLILGEAAAAIVLSRVDDTPPPGTALIRGGAARCAPGNPTMCEAEDLRAVMQAALTNARTSADALLAVRAHGTGTPANDQAEGLALRELVGESIPVSSFKPWFGHTLGASGLVEMIALLAGWERGQFLKTPGFAQCDPAIGLQPLQQNREIPRHGAILCNSFGFGGNNTALVVERTC